jgi:hypothetical protein
VKGSAARCIVPKAAHLLDNNSMKLSAKKETMMKTYRLMKPTFLLILAMASILVGVAAAQEGDRVPSDAQAVTWSDNFESYPVDPWPTFPNPPWTNAGHNDAGVYNDQYISGGQSLKLIGIFGPGECGGSIAYRPIGGVAPMDITIWIRNGDQPLEGCHQKYGAVELATGPGWTYDHRGLIAFTETGQILGGDWEVDEDPGMFLGTYTADTWYKVQIHYELYDAGNVRLTYSINDSTPPTELITPIKSHEPYLSYIGLWGAEGVAWFDDITVTSTEGAPPPPPGNLFLPSIINR